MIRKITIFSTFLLISFTASAQVFTGNLSNARTTGDWTSAKLSGESLETRYRAAVQADGDLAMVFFDVYEGDCLSDLLFSFPMDGGANQDINAAMDISLRIDDGSVYSLDGYMMVTMGDKSGMIGLSRTDNYQRIISQMRSGNALRARFTFKSGGDPTFMSFSLRGFSSASSRVQDMCKSA